MIDSKADWLESRLFEVPAP